MRGGQVRLSFLGPPPPQYYILSAIELVATSDVHLVLEQGTVLFRIVHILYFHFENIDDFCRNSGKKLEALKVM